MVCIIDYGVGNLYSLKSSFEKIGADIVVSNDENVISRANKIVLPGVGAFEDAANKLENSGLKNVLVKEKDKGKPILGICLGMQLLFDTSYEYGVHKGLGFIHGDVVPIANVIPDEFKIPHIGWNALKFEKDSKLFKYIKNGDYVYFVHSYYASKCSDITAVSEYVANLTASVEKDNIFGCQFHPEKSGNVGLNILRAFCELEA